MKLLAGTLGFVLTLVLVFFSWMWLSTFHPGEAKTMEVVSDGSAPGLSGDENLKILSWNVQYMAGKNYHFYYDSGSGPDERPSSDDIDRTTTEVARVIRDENPDVILLQEVDDGAKRTDHEDQLEKLLALLPDEYCCHASAFYWKAAFVPHPHIMGSVGMKLSVISKYRMVDGTRYRLALKPDNFIVQQFDLKRAVLEVRLPTDNGDDLTVFNTHLSAFAHGTDTLTKQVNKIDRLLRETDTEGRPWILGGDFNLLPPGEKGDEYVETRNGVYGDEREIKVLFDNYQPVPTYEEVNGDDNEDWFTHFPNNSEVKEPDKTIDYLFLSDGTRLGEHYVIQEKALEISDHLPVVAEVSLAAR
ncbi:endonuclease/exonuclease/phosphatase family protein [Candidatus Bipolaricaulota bacterium]|nr:endonuclease/exonuclease/phosphatase family protein [Candidatus Bipolaricaulota bacterium]